MKKIIFGLILGLCFNGILWAKSVEIVRTDGSNTQVILDPNGYREAEWGMTQEEVKAAIPDVKWENFFGTLQYKDKILTYDTLIKFFFTDKKLSKVETEIGVDTSKSRDLFNSLTNILIQKYGEAAMWRDTKSTSYNKIEWLLLKTHIILRDESSSNFGYVRIIYTELKEGTKEDKEKL